jgi:hypothetical protein
MSVVRPMLRVVHGASKPKRSEGAASRELSPLATLGANGH